MLIHADVVVRSSDGDALRSRSEHLRDERRRSGARASRRRRGNEGTVLTVEQILAWADAHHAAHGAWPAVGPGTVSGSGDVEGTRRESWKAINHTALCFGLRGLPGDSSLAELLAEHRGAPLPDMGPKALAEKIRAWEEEHFPSTGPRLRLPKGPRRTPLTIDAILAWADAFHAAHGRWPGNRDQTVQAAPDQTWGAIDKALRQGYRGLPGGSSLGRLLVQHRGPEARPQPPRLTVELILAWADQHYARTGDWPTANSGAIPESPGDTWGKIELAAPPGGPWAVGKELAGAPSGRPSGETASRRSPALHPRADLHLGRRPSCGHRPMAHKEHRSRRRCAPG